MIKFDINNLTIEHVYIKTITQALGGSITVVDQVTDESTRIPIPYHVARRFIKEHKVQHYVVPVLAAVMYYEDIIVAVERHHLGNLGVEQRENVFGEVVKWESRMEKVVEELTPDFTNRQWWVDGTSVYEFIAGEQDMPLSSDGTFSGTPCRAIDFADFQLEASVKSAEAKMKRKVCLKFVVEGITVVSPPVWKSIDAVGKHSVIKAEGSDGDVGLVTEQSFPYDSINDILLVNINFALNAAKELSTVFGYESIEPLCLDDLMVKMTTVNLAALESHVKKTSEVGMTYTHAVSWLMGFVYRSTTLKELMNVRALFKYLSSTGCYQKRKLTTDAIFKAGKQLDDVLDVNVKYEMEKAQ